MTTKQQTDSLLNEREAAEWLGVSTGMLRGLRTKGGGPVFSKLGGKIIRYRREALNEWVEKNERRHTSEERPR